MPQGKIHIFRIFLHAFLLYVTGFSKNGTMQCRQGSFQSDSFRQKSNESYDYDMMSRCGIVTHKSYYEALEEIEKFSGNNNDELLLPL